MIEFLKIDPLESENLKRIVVNMRAGLKSDDVIYAATTPASDPKDFINLPEKQLHIMRKWWNFAIMDLLTCQLPLPFTAEVIAAMLPIPVDEVLNSLTELSNIGLIKKWNNGAGFSCSANRKNIPLAKQKLAAALRECALLLSEGDCDDVFFVQGQMFSVLKK